MGPVWFANEGYSPEAAEGATEGEGKEAMTILVDPDIEKVAAFMQAELPASKLIAVASWLAALAPVLWGRYGRDEITPATVRSVTDLSECKPTVSTR